MTTSFIDEYSEHLVKSLPAVAERFAEGNREAIQTVVWLVGTATALLALIAANNAVATSVGARRPVILVLLLSVVICGVVHRVLLLIGSRFERVLLWNLENHLVGLTLSVSPPPVVDETWTREELIGKIREFFGVNYDFLETYNVAIPKCQEAYTELRKIWEGGEKHKAETLGLTIGAYGGMDEDKSRVMFTSTRDQKEYRDDVRRRGRRVKAWYRGAQVTFVLTCIAFVAAIVAFASAVWSR